MIINSMNGWIKKWTNELMNDKWISGWIVNIIMSLLWPVLQVDHANTEYSEFRKNFYNEVPEITRMTDAQVEDYRAELDGVRVRGPAWANCYNRRLDKINSASCQRDSKIRIVMINKFNCFFSE